jgi:hypothetical protein
MAPGVGTVTNKASFLKYVCLADPHAEPDPEASVRTTVRNIRQQPPQIESKALTMYRRDLHMREFLEKQEHLLKKRADGEPTEPVHDLDDATFIAGEVTAMYQLKSKPHIGVLALPTMSVHAETEILMIMERLTTLDERNVTHIIIDTTGNGGGDVAFASLLVHVFFPSSDKSQSSHLARFRDSPAASALGAADLANEDESTYFESNTLVDKTTFLPYTTNVFDETVNMTVNGRVAEYTEQFIMDYNLTTLNQTTKYPWSDDASKITILTDGQCGSACGMFSDHMVNKHGVKAVAVGGYAKKGLSMFSFAGASVLGLDAIVDAFQSLSVPPTLTRLSYKNNVNVGMIEVYSGNDTIPLEYNPARYVAAHRLDYTAKTASHQDLLWGAVAETAWPGLEERQ